MSLGRTSGRLLALAAFASVVAAPFACGAPFSAVNGNAGPDGSTEAGADVTTPDGSADAHPEATSDGPSQLDGIVFSDAGAVVQGKVVDAYLLPLSGLAVRCQGQTATTAADGAFTLTGITRPYTAAVVAPQATGRKHGYVFEGVSRLDPTLQLAGEQSQLTQTGTFDVTLSTGAPNAGGIVFADFPAGTPAVLTPTDPIVVGSSSFSGPFSWIGAPAATPTLYVLQWLNTNNLPSVYIAFQSETATLTNGATTSWAPPMVFTLAAGSMTVTVKPSSGYVPIDIGVYIRPADAGVAAAIQHGANAGATSSTFVTPDAPNATFVACGLQVRDDFDGGPNQPFGYTCTTGLGVNDTPTVAPPPATTFVSPPSMAGAGTVFNYAALTGGVYFVAFAPTGAAASTSDALFFVTADTQVAVPDQSVLPFLFRSGDPFTAQVLGIAPFTGIDGALGPAGFSERINDQRLDTGPSTTGSLAYGGSAPFTAQ